MNPMQAEKLARIRGHLEGYADALEAKITLGDAAHFVANRHLLINALREDAAQLEQLDQLEEGAR